MPYGYVRDTALLYWDIPQANFLLAQNGLIKSVRGFLKITYILRHANSRALPFSFVRIIFIDLSFLVFPGRG